MINTRAPDGANKYLAAYPGSFDRTVENGPAHRLHGEQSSISSHFYSFTFGGELGRLTMAETKANTVKQLLCDAANPRSQHDSLTAWWLLKAALLSLNGKSLSHCWGFEQILSSCSAYFSNWGTVIFDPFNCHKTCLKYPWWNLTLERQYICKRVRNVLYIYPPRTL